ncbi:MAG TPA: hypothetical protein VII40_09255 [Xanthobacteraceae bacterium]
MPPAITHEIARGLNASLAVSAGGKTIRLMHRGVEAGEERAGAQQRKGGVQDRKAAQDAGDRAAQRAHLERGEPPEFLRDDADRQRPDPHAEHVGAHRDGGVFLAGERGADDAGGADDHHRVAAGERLRDREHQRVALGKAITGIDQGLGDGRHEPSLASRSGRMLVCF